MRYAASNLSDRIGADSCPCAFHWLQYLLGQPRLSKNFSRGASRGPLRARRRAELQASFSRPHRVRDCHHDHRCGALAAGFSEHQPVAVAHAMGLNTEHVLPSVAPALASVAVSGGLILACQWFVNNLSLVRSAAPEAAGFGFCRANASSWYWWARRGARSGHGRAFKKFAAAAGCPAGR